jgi:hypothetical protein
MAKRSVAAILLLLTAVLLTVSTAGVLIAQEKAAPTEYSFSGGPPPFTHAAEYYGFITSNREVGRGHNITAEEIKKSVAAGGQYVLLGSPGGTKLIEPQEKAAAFAGQQVFVTMSLTTQKYGSGPSSDPSLEGYPRGGDRPAPRRDTYKIISIKATAYNDAWKPENVPPSYWRGNPPEGYK